MSELPAATERPCVECPWRRDSAAGWLGPHTAQEWVELAHSDQPIACHMTIEEDGNWDTLKIRQCRGAAIYRANVFKSPRNPEVAVGPKDLESVFGFGEFVQHHTKESDAT